MKKSKPLLKLTYKDAIERIHDIGKEIAKQYHIPYETTTIDQTANACVIENNGKIKKLQINIAKIIEKKSFQRHIPDLPFVTALCAIYHEAAHCYQMDVIYQKENPNKDDIDLTINYASRKGNDRYYAGNGNYFKNPNEINAEYNGIRNTYKYLRNTFPNLTAKDCEQLTLDYINNFIANFTYWIPSDHGQPYTSLNDVYQAFDKAYNESKTAQRWYFRRTDSPIQDEAMKFMIKQEQHHLFDTFLDYPYGMAQDRAIASIVCFLHPEYQKCYKTLKNVDLSLETIWHITLKERHREVPEHMNEIYQKDLKKQESLYYNTEYPSL